MKKFVYKYESLKRTKEIFSKKVQKDISELNNKIEKLLEEIDKRELEIKESMAETACYKRIADIVAAEKFREFLSAQITSLRNSISALERERDIKLKELISRNQETKIFETLEGIHLQDFIKEENKNEESVLNEIAIQKFIKGSSE